MKMESEATLMITDNSKSVHQDLINYYCDISVNNVCRVCLEKCQPHKKMLNIFETKQKHLPSEVSTMIMACASIQIMEGDGLPNTICSRCFSKLNVAWQFKILCENSDAKLRQFYFNNSQQLQFTQEFDGFNFKPDQNLCLLKQNESISTAYNGTTNEMLNFNTVSSCEEQNDDDLCKKAKIGKKSKRQKLDGKKEQKVHQCDTCGKTFNRREYLTQHIRIHTGEKPYRCHLCEKRFVNSGHLTTHMRTHTGERPHACNLCPKAFSTRQELNKHTMVHNGDRPFVCKMCGKSFGSSSNLYSHLKHHTGEKNFTCEHCGKAFYTKQELKQHLVIHTGEKAFLCEYCNKRFSQIAHLRRHSKLHK